MAALMDEKKPADYTPHYHRVRWRFLTRRRPFCPDHPEQLMTAKGKTKDGKRTRYYCPIVGCTNTYKIKPTIESRDQIEPDDPE